MPGQDASNNSAEFTQPAQCMGQRLVHLWLRHGTNKLLLHERQILTHRVELQWICNKYSNGHNICEVSS